MSFVQTHFSKFQRPVSHLIFWVAYWFIFAYTYSRYDGDLAKTLITEGCQMPFRMLAAYGSLWVLERVRHPWRAFFGAATVVFASGLLVRVLKMAYLVPVWFPTSTFQFWNYRLVVDTFDCALAAGLALSARFYFQKQDLLRRENALRTEKSAAELQALKNQLHPHFLFNTINNLYVLARVKSDKTAPAALQLAGLLRYVLYESAAETVPFDREIATLRDYLALEKLRFDEDRLRVEFEIKTDAPAHPIAPLLLLPLVENAFKHGASEKSDDAWVSISISLKNNVLEAKIENSNPSQTASQTPGIGLQNLRRRLQLIYPNRHELTLENLGETYRARLVIDSPTPDRFFEG